MRKRRKGVHVREEEGKEQKEKNGYKRRKSCKE